MSKVAFLGLGVMGYPMAGHLVGAGHDVSAWNRTASVTDRWNQTFSGQACASVEEAVSGADFVMMCVGQDADVLAVAKKAIPAMTSGSILVDHTTASDGCAKQVGAICAEAGIGFLDAPIWAAHENGQSDLYRRPVAGPLRSRELRPSRRARHGRSRRRDREGRGPKLANG